MSYTTTALINNNKKKKDLPENNLQIRGSNAAGLRRPLFLYSLLLPLLNFFFFLNKMTFWPIFGPFYRRGRVGGQPSAAGGEAPYRPLRGR